MGGHHLAAPPSTIHPLLPHRQNGSRLLPQNPKSSSDRDNLVRLDNLETFVADINSGRWDAILPQVAQLKLPRKKLEDLYEQLDTDRAILRQTQAMSVMKQEQP
ncbi:hypothetical protein L2E82_30481 [Cichorium intybus]|uniref:Uncharacterized protein n=1 Tax=Cichorium intybus TaxID=13427 RepID=A0ACB9D0F0_CICIN|nr:hypothetical protein L2E82_30481 [Cichorium intybus]